MTKTKMPGGPGRAVDGCLTVPAISANVMNSIYFENR